MDDRSNDKIKTPSHVSDAEQRFALVRRRFRSRALFERSSRCAANAASKRAAKGAAMRCIAHICIHLPVPPSPTNTNLNCGSPCALRMVSERGVPQSRSLLRNTRPSATRTDRHCAETIVFRQRHCRLYVLTISKFACCCDFRFVAIHALREATFWLFYSHLHCWLCHRHRRATRKPVRQTW